MATSMTQLTKRDTARGNTHNDRETMTTKMTMTLPGILLRLEGLAVLGLSVWLYARQDASWLLFALLLLAPDLSMVGYMGGNRFGAIAYNLAHTCALPAILAAIGLASGNDLFVSLALIWTAHIGMDRAIGYGLKYSDGFKVTHLSRV